MLCSVCLPLLLLHDSSVSAAYYFGLLDCCFPKCGFEINISSKVHILLARPDQFTIQKGELVCVPFV